jgi:hypothetical protein
LIRAGYSVTAGLNDKTLSEIRRFLRDCTAAFQSRYIMVSLPPTFCYPEKNDLTTLLNQAILPHCLEHNQPFALMPGVNRAVNPSLKMAGDGVAACDVGSVSNLAASHPRNKFLVTMLCRENQYELCVAARKFRNLHLFGCWWFLNTPTLVEEMTRMRIELLGTSFTAQHSDARVVEQLLYKWKHTKAVLKKVLAEKYLAVSMTGWPVSEATIRKDVADLLGGSFKKFLRQNF